MTWITAGACSDWDCVVIGKITGSEDDARQGLLDAVNEILDERRADYPGETDKDLFDCFPKNISDIGKSGAALKTEINFAWWSPSVHFIAFPIDGLPYTGDTWMILSYENDGDEINLTHCDGDAKCAKKRVASMVRDLKRSDPGHFEYGTTAIRDVDGCDGTLDAYAVFTDYHVDITARRLCDIP